MQVYESLTVPPEVQQLLVELVTVMMWWELMKLAVHCEMQAAQEKNELGFDEDNHIQYHILSCNK
jgi:hypothetical protein